MRPTRVSRLNVKLCDPVAGQRSEAAAQVLAELFGPKRRTRHVRRLYAKAMERVRIEADPDVRRLLVRIFSHNLPRARDSTRLLVNLIRDDPSATVRAEALRSLATRWLFASPNAKRRAVVVGILSRGLHDEHPYVRSSAVDACFMLGLRELSNELEALMTDRETSEHGVPIGRKIQDTIASFVGSRS